MPQGCNDGQLQSAHSGLQLALHPGRDAGQRRRQRRRIGAAGLREIRPTAALAADLRGHGTDDFAGLEARGQIRA